MNYFFKNTFKSFLIVGLTIFLSSVFVFSGVQAEGPGCTDSLALNYIATSTIEDGSCTYPTLTISTYGTQLPSFTTPNTVDFGGAFTFVVDEGSVVVNEVSLTQVGSFPSDQISDVDFTYAESDGGVCQTIQPGGTLSLGYNSFSGDIVTLNNGEPMTVGTNPMCVYIVYNTLPDSSESLLGYSVDFEISSAEDIVLSEPSANITMTAPVNIPGISILVDESITTSLLSLRMADTAKDPTVFYLKDDAIWKKVGVSTSTRLTNSNLIIQSLNFENLTRSIGEGIIRMVTTVSNVAVGAPSSYLNFTKTYSTTASTRSNVSTSVATSIHSEILPVIIMSGTASTTVTLGSPYTDAGATATDSFGSDISEDIVTTGASVNTSILGDHIVTFNVTDALGNAALQKTRTVTVVESSPFMIATGGTVTEVGIYKIHTFTSNNTFNVTNLGDGLVDVLVVGGGGGGGRWAGAGGGGGGVQYDGSYSVIVDSYSVIVGDGGSGGIDGVNSSNGENSVFDTITAYGGGWGGGNGSGSDGHGGSGASSGGVGGNWGYTVQSATQGNVGGTASQSSNAYGAGGGGGSGSTGSNGNSTSGGNGGAGVANSITGSSVDYGGGGGGGVNDTTTTPGTGGVGGGGNGSRSNTTPTAGTANTGGGGGGGGGNAGAGPQNGANGGSGVVIIRYQYLPATVPDAPTIGTATAGNATSTITYTAPGSDGGSTILYYTITSSSTGAVISATTTSSTTATLTGLTNGTTYTFSVTATNAIGTSASSSASNSVTPTAPVPTYMVATGGATTTDGNYMIHTFTGSGTFTVTNLGDGLVDVLVVGGGGGGGGYVYSGGSGGGGGGGFTSTTSLSISQTAHSITVGAGGSAGSNGAHGISGGASSFGSYISVLGGGGGGRIPTVAEQAPSGSSGGGGGGKSGSKTSTGGAGTSGQGYAGGTGKGATNGGDGGGGGGAGGAGHYQAGWANINGGDGKASSITGTSLYYAGGGGGGGVYIGGGLGGSSVGGRGSGRMENLNSTTPTANRGGGGGGGASDDSPAVWRPPSAGADGVVIIRYQFQ